MQMSAAIRQPIDCMLAEILDISEPRQRSLLGKMRKGFRQFPH